MLQPPHSHLYLPTQVFIGGDQIPRRLPWRIMMGGISCLLALSMGLFFALNKAALLIALPVARFTGLSSVLYCCKSTYAGLVMPPIVYPGNSVSKEARAKAGGGFESAIEVAAPSGLQFVAETGFSITGNVEDLAEVTISGQDFGTKAPQRHFDRIDRYWANGTEVVDAYSGLSDGSSVTVGSGNPFLGNQGSDMSSMRLKTEAARQGRALGYQIDSGPSGNMEADGLGFTNDGFPGWPSNQRDSEEVYIRYWRFQRYFGTDGDADPAMALASPLSAGATVATLDQGPASISNNVDGLEEFYITLDSGELHYCIQSEPIVSDTEFNFTPSLPSPASAGNPVYRRKNSVNKNIRLRDDPEGTGFDYNVWNFSGFQGSISNENWSLVAGKPQARWEAGVWELHEYYIRAPKDQAREPGDHIKRVRINGEMRLDLRGTENTASNGSLIDPPKFGWPSSGLGIALLGFEQDRLHIVPNNKYRISDIYIDGDASNIGVRRRVEIGIGSDDLYLCSNREPCPIKTWSTDITVNLNALPFTESELAQGRIFVVDADDVPTLVGRVQ